MEILQPAFQKWARRVPTNLPLEYMKSPSILRGPKILVFHKKFQYDLHIPCLLCKGQNRRFLHSLLCQVTSCPTSGPWKKNQEYICVLTSIFQKIQGVYWGLQRQKINSSILTYIWFYFHGGIVNQVQRKLYRTRLGVRKRHPRVCASSNHLRYKNKQISIWINK